MDADSQNRINRDPLFRCFFTCEMILLSPQISVKRLSSLICQPEDKQKRSANFAESLALNYRPGNVLDGNRKDLNASKPATTQPA